MKNPYQNNGLFQRAIYWMVFGPPGKQNAFLFRVRKTTTKTTHGFLFVGGPARICRRHTWNTKGLLTYPWLKQPNGCEASYRPETKNFTESLARFVFYLLGCSLQGNIPVPVNFRNFRSFILTKKTYILIGSGRFLNAGRFLVCGGVIFWMVYLNHRIAEYYSYSAISGPLDKSFNFIFQYVTLKSLKG